MLFPVSDDEKLKEKKSNLFILSGHNAWAEFILHYQFWKKFLKKKYLCADRT